MFNFLKFILKFIYFERVRVSAHAWAGEGQRDTERVPSRLHAASAESDLGLKLPNCEITTWAEIKSQMLNWLSHPGAPFFLHILDRLCLLCFVSLPIPTVFLVWSHSLFFLLTLPRGYLCPYMLSAFCLVGEGHGFTLTWSFICGNVFLSPSFKVCFFTEDLHLLLWFLHTDGVKFGPKLTWARLRG